MCVRGVNGPRGTSDLAMVLLALPLAVLGSACSALTAQGCNVCIRAQSLFSFECTWCALDNGCHDLGSLESKCTAHGSQCSSLSKLSHCKNSTCPTTARPSQIHLAFGADSTSMAVSWYTPTAVPSVVSYGKAGSTTQRVNGTSKSYLAEHGYHHTAVMSGLAAGSNYSYRVGDGTDEGSSATFGFVTAPGRRDEVRLSMFGDHGYLGSEQRPCVLCDLHVAGLEANWTAMPTRATMGGLVRSGAVHGVWALGDIAYADDAGWKQAECAHAGGGVGGGSNSRVKRTRSVHDSPHAS
jgi:hypothetical protein